MIDHRNKLVFVHIPRTAGESIESVFGHRAEVERSGKVRGKHLTFDEYLDRDPDVRNYFKFTFVRNTWDLMVSVWRFLVTHPRTSGHFSGLVFEDFLADDFAMRLQEVIERETDWDQALVTIIRKSQLHWIDERLDFVGRFEYLDRDFASVCARMGLEDRLLPRVNRTDRTHYGAYYSEDTARVVGDRFRDEIERFGFAFGAQQATSSYPAGT